MLSTVRMIQYHYDEFDTTHCSIFDITIEAENPREAEGKAWLIFNEKTKIYSSKGEAKYIGIVEGAHYRDENPSRIVGSRFCTTGETYHHIVGEDIKYLFDSDESDPWVHKFRGSAKGEAPGGSESDLHYSECGATYYSAVSPKGLTSDKFPQKGRKCELCFPQ